MIIIAHRALFEGPEPLLENHPDQIQTAINHGFHVEIDIRYIDGKWWLGHDQPQYEVEADWLWLGERRKYLWLHAKDIATLYKLHTFDFLDADMTCLRSPDKRMHHFFHDQDDCALTSLGKLWTFPGKPLTKSSIAVLPERVSNWANLDKCFGICTDFAFQYRGRFKP